LASGCSRALGASQTIFAGCAGQDQPEKGFADTGLDLSRRPKHSGQRADDAEMLPVSHSSLKKVPALLVPPDTQTGDQQSKISGRMQKKVLGDLALPAWLAQEHIAAILSLAEEV
jgi:hypothetical protein